MTTMIKMIVDFSKTQTYFENKVLLFIDKVGLGGLGETCSPWDTRFSGSHPAEVDGFFQDVNILSTSPPGGTLSWGSRV